MSSKTLEDLLAEVLAAYDRGESPDLAGLAAEHPQHAAALREFVDADSWMREAATGMVAASRSAARATAWPALDGFRIVREIARGGMGVVFEAEQAVPQRRVALKMLRDVDLASQEDVRRFRQEAQAAAELEHPGIVRILEVGVRAGQAWYSMPLATGGNLAERMPEWIGDPRRAAGLVRDVARAVAHGHARGILHRDLKPSNILLDGEDGALVADFGLARRLAGGGDERTRSGTVLGTPAYMPPEQARGDLRTVDERSDIWSLGVILYELLSGRPPFVSDSPIDTLDRVMNAEFPRLLRVAPGTPRALAAICECCLRRVPSERYPSMRDLADDLDRYLQGEPVRARARGPAGRLRRWARSRARMLTVGVMAGCVAALLVFAWLAAREREEETLRRRELELRVLAQRRAEEGDAVEAALHFAAAHALRPSWEAGCGLRAHVPPVPRLLHAAGEHALWRVRFDSTGRWVAAGSADGVVYLWDREQPHAAPRRIVQARGTDVRGLDFDAAGARLATGDEAGVVRVYEIPTLRALAQVRTAPAGERPAVLTLRWLDDGRIAAGDEGGRVHLYEPRADRLVTIPVAQPPFAVSALVPLAAPARLVVGYGTGPERAALRVLDVQRGVLVGPAVAHATAVWDAAYDARTGLVATADEREVRLLRAGDLETVARIPHAAAVGAVAFADEGRVLYSATVSGDVQAFDTATARPRGRPFRHRAQVYGVSCCGRTGSVGTVGRDGTLRLWAPAKARPGDAVLRAADGDDHGAPWRCTGSWQAPDEVLAWTARPDGLHLELLAAGEREARAAARLRLAPAFAEAIQPVAPGRWWLVRAAADAERDRTSVRLRALALTGAQLEAGSPGPTHHVPGRALAVGLAPPARRLWVLTSAGLHLFAVDDRLDLQPMRTIAGPLQAWLSPGARWCAYRLDRRPRELVIERTADGSARSRHAMPADVARAALAADGATLAVTFSDDRRVLLYDVPGRRVRAELPWPLARQLRFAARGRALVARTEGARIRVCSSASGAPLGVRLRLPPTLPAGRTRIAEIAPGWGEQALYATTRRGAVVRLDTAWLAGEPDAAGWERLRLRAQLAAMRRITPAGTLEPLDHGSWARLRTRLEP